MTFHIPLEEAVVAGFLIWLGISILWNVGDWLRGLLWAGIVVAYHHVYFRIWAWKARPRKVRRKDP